METPALSRDDRRRLVEEISAGTPLLIAAAEYGVTRDTAAGLLHRWLLHGDTGLTDRQVAKAV